MRYLCVGRLTWSIISRTMSEAHASESRPAPPSEPSRVFTSDVQNIEEDVVCARAQLCSTFPTDQVPQPVQRDTIVLTTMAAPTDSRGAACLPQSAPTVQAQVSSTGCVSCDDCTHITLQHNHGGLVCSATRPVDFRGDRAGPPEFPSQPLSVISGSSCPAFSRPDVIFSPVTPTSASQFQSRIPVPSTRSSSGGNSKLKSNNKRQSVNVTRSLAANVSKGNTNDKSTVTEPNIKPQRNITVRRGEVPPAAPNNNSVKSLDVVNVSDKNSNKNGALILFPDDAKKQFIPDDDIPVVIITVQGKKYSKYYPPNRSFNDTFSEIEYASNMMNNMSNFNAESECRSGIVSESDVQLLVLPSGGNMIVASTACPLDDNDDDEKIRRSRFYETTPPKRNDCDKQRRESSFAELLREQLGSGKRERLWAERYGRSLRLCGGGESSVSTGTSGWGSPPAANANNNNGNNSGWGTNPASQNSNAQGNWNNNPARNSGTGPGQGPPNSQDGSSNKSNSQNSNQQQNPNQNQPPASQSGNNQGWNQGGGAGGGNKQNNQPPQGASNPGANPQQGNAQQNPQQNAVAAPSSKQQMEQLNSMREALFSQDGWGGQHVNQDTNWDIPSSPEPGQKGDGPSGPPLWKPAVNNGTELWEANLRNGGQPPPQPVQKTPWGHTPTTNIGGTWGEDDDVSDSSNVWTGVPNNPPQWGGATSGNGNAGGMWGGSKKENDWSGSAGGSAAWGDPRADPRAAGIDPREAMRASTIDPRAAPTGADPRDPMRMIASEAMRESMRDPRDLRALADMRGDPRGISGRLNGEAMWGAPPQPPHHMGHHQPPGKMVGPAPNGVNQWAGPPPKDMGGMGTKPTGWEEPSPPPQRRHMPNFDDGTSLWGNPNQQQTRMGTGGPMGARSGACPPGMVGAGAGRKPGDASLWGRNGSWGDEAPPHWTEDAWGKPKAPAGTSWDTEIDWHKQGPAGPKLTKEIVWNSKQFRLLVDMGYKKEDVENALRLRDMNVEDALDILSPARPGVDTTWRGSAGGAVSGQAGRHDEHAPYDHTGAAGPYGGQRFGPTGPGQMPFPPGGNAPNLMNNMGAATGNPSLASIGNMSPAVVQKMLAAGSGSAAPGAGSGVGAQAYGASGAQARSQPPQAPQSQPSTQQLRMLVQQIQMAVQAGYLNHQILNQPLAPQTLILLNQLLQQIKVLQQLMQQHSVMQAQSSLGVAKPNSNVMLQVSVQITKTKQQINNLQNQIAANQAIYVKQQMGGSAAAGPSDFFKNSMHDPISALQGNFSDLTINKEPPTSYASQQQSRLTQWKLPALDKDDTPGSDFSRAPGSVAKPPAPHASPSMNPLGLGQSDGPWSTGRSADAGGWPDASTDGPDGSVKEPWPSAQPSPAAFTDLVPEFEPGKPWKMKSIEDDPSITPGSVVRSPLSLATIKDTEIFSAAPPSSAVPQSKASPSGDSLQPLSLSSSTWSFNPPASTTSAFTSPLSKLGSKGTWGDVAPPPTAVTSELWGAPPMAKSRGPPPGLAKGGAGGVNATNGWGGLGGARSATGGASWGSSNWGSPWLLLRNLTAQIDGSTLRTLCMQHGPLQSFHLSLNHGFALVKYCSREEATKAQTALNNCVLGNTTILAESPADTDVNTLMQNLAQQSGAGTAAGSGWRGGGAATKGGADTWGNACWPPNPSAAGAGGSLWGTTSSTMDTDTQRATPSSLNSFLPGDLLGDSCQTYSPVI